MHSVELVFVMGSVNDVLVIFFLSAWFYSTCLGMLSEVISKIEVVGCYKEVFVSYGCIIVNVDCFFYVMWEDVL